MMTTLALGLSLTAAALLLWFLIRRPTLDGATKLSLLFGLGVLPIASAFATNLVGFENTTMRKFCASCHVMTPYTNDAANPASNSLPAVHSRTAWFGEKSCYTCHSDYGMFGTVATKAAGLKHVWHYYRTYRTVPLAEVLPKLHLYKPFPNLTCMQCHSTRLAAWSRVPEHTALADDVRRDKVSCASEGCHGPAHPFSKVGRPKQPVIVLPGVQP